jgi:NTP pyrophosphatase (non-canonical NTP hydrolase)
MDRKLLQKVIQEEVRGTAKWGNTDKSPSILLNAATEELGEVAHAINHDEGKDAVAQEIAETIGVLSRLYDMVIPPAAPPSPIGRESSLSE